MQFVSRVAKREQRRLMFSVSHNRTYPLNGIAKIGIIVLLLTQVIISIVRGCVTLIKVVSEFRRFEIL